MIINNNRIPFLIYKKTARNFWTTISIRKINHRRKKKKMKTNKLLIISNN